MSEIVFRRGTPADAAACGRICYEAFATLNARHDFPPDFPSPDVSSGLLEWMLGRPDVYSVIAERDGRVVGSNFLWENGPIAGVGPITVDPSAQNASVGRRMMELVLERARERKHAGVRLVQAAFHNRSLSLYTKLGFDVREPLSCIQGSPVRASVPGYAVRPATERDVDGCNALCRDVHGNDRADDLMGGIARSTARVVEHDGRLTGYCSDIGFFGHAVGRGNPELMALIGAAEMISGPGLLLPSRNGELLRWCLAGGLRIVQPLTLMSLGLYSEPAGRFLPSILY